MSGEAAFRELPVFGELGVSRGQLLCPWLKKVDAHGPGSD
jgi:hypothetical protein